MARISVALCGALALLTSSMAAQAAGEGKSLQLSKVVLDTETSEVSARIKGGTLCVFPETTKLPREKKTQSHERFDRLFAAKLKESGFAVVSTASEMFANAEEESRGDYLLGVTLRPVTVNLCSSVSGWKGEFALQAEWQIFDRAAKAVVETVTTDGRGAQEKFAADGLDQMINQAFTDSLGALIKAGVVQKYARAAGAE